MALSSDEIRGADCVLAIQPHYDDNDLGAGGTLAALSRGGAEIHYLTATDDLVGVIDASLSDEAATAQLRAEQREAGTHIGVSGQHWLGFPDAGDYDYFDLRRGIIQHIRALRPAVLFSVDPWLPLESHRDHLMVGRAVAEAALLYKFPRLTTAADVDAAYVPHDLLGVCFYFTREPNLCFDITATRERKHSAIDAYRAQLSEKELAVLHPGLDWKERDWARDESFSHGEGLKAVRAGQLHVNLVD